jgi:hypothetical protein
MRLECRSGRALAGCALSGLLAVGLVGCAPAIAGTWVTPDSSSYFQNGTLYAPNRLTIGSDGTGRATIHFVLVADPSTLHSEVFEVDWSERTSSAFTLTLACVQSDVPGGCNGHDFTMSCDITLSSDNDPSGMTCSGDGAWSNYDFPWQPVQD